MRVIGSTKENMALSKLELSELYLECFTFFFWTSYRWLKILTHLWISTHFGNFYTLFCIKLLRLYIMIIQIFLKMIFFFGLKDLLLSFVSSYPCSTVVRNHGNIKILDDKAVPSFKPRKIYLYAIWASFFCLILSQVFFIGT